MKDTVIKSIVTKIFNDRNIHKTLENAGIAANAIESTAEQLKQDVQKNLERLSETTSVEQRDAIFDTLSQDGRRIENTLTKVGHNAYVGLTAWQQHNTPST